MTEEIVGSKMHPEAFYGQVGSDQKSSLLPGDTIKRSTVAKSIMKGTEVTLPAASNQVRSVSPKSYPVNPGAKGRAGDAIAKVPAQTQHGALAALMYRKK